MSLTRSGPRRTLRYHPRRLLLALMILAAVLLPGRAGAWKIETHVWIAQQVLNDVVPDGKVTLWLGGLEYEYVVDRAVWDALRLYPAAYRAGSMGPDAFPDLVGGQMTTHPGLPNVPGGWRTDDWLKWIVSRAKKTASPELAFAYGYLTHAASDVFGHSYINSYAGDIFVITENQEGALRHVAAETLIKDHNPPLANHTGGNLGQPYDVVDVAGQGRLAEFLRDAFILNGRAADQYRAAGPATAHLALMYDFWVNQGEVLQAVNDAVGAVNGAITPIQDRIDWLQGEIDRIKNMTVKIPFIGRVHIYPAYCFVDPGTCLAVKATEATLAATRASLSVLMTTNNTIAASVRAPVQNWRNDVEEALKQYIITGQEVAKALMQPGGDPKAKLTEWACKYAPVFAAIPDELTVAGCSAGGFAQDRVGQITGGVDWVTERLPDSLGWLVNPLGKVKSEISSKIVPGLVRTLAEGIAGDDSMLVSLAQLRFEGFGPDSVNQVFAEDDSGLSLLEIPDAAERIRGDMGGAPDGPFDPEVFSAAHNSAVLAKLALLGAPELNRLVMDAGVYITIYGPTLYAATSPTRWGTTVWANTLFDAVGSIDGNQQWQEVALPYLRNAVAPDPDWPAERRFGYPYTAASGDVPASGGLRFWQDCEAREKLFKRLFRGPLAPNLVDAASAVVSPWESETDPFPLSAQSKDVTKVLQLGGELRYVCGERPADMEVLPPGTVVVTPDDLAPPAIEAPPDVRAACTADGAAGQAVELGEPVVTDDRDRDPVVSHDGPALFPLGTTTVTWTATDWVSNSSQARQAVTVFDDVAPVFTGGALPVLTAFATSPEGAEVTPAAPAATDACAGTATVAQAAPTTVFPLGETDVIWIATDTAGNQARSIQRVIVTAMKGDLDIDGDVDPLDLLILIQARGPVGRRPLGAPVLSDYDEDGDIDDTDRGVFELIQLGRGDPRDLNGDWVLDATDIVMLARLYTH